jgi:hypothetical protein
VLRMNEKFLQLVRFDDLAFIHEHHPVRHLAREVKFYRRPTV